MLRVLIVDDESPARKRLRKLLQPHLDAGRLEIVGEAADGPTALEMLAAEPVDLLFLDIHMPEMDGFEVLERIPPERHPVIVFTTAYDDYALRAFEANAVDYLLKPISRERLDDALARAERLTPETRQDNDERLSRLLDWVEAQAAPAQPPPDSTPRRFLEQISIPYRDRILIVPVERRKFQRMFSGSSKRAADSSDSCYGCCVGVLVQRFLTPPEMCHNALPRKLLC